MAKLTTDDRAKLVAIGHYLISKAPQIDYSQNWPEQPMAMSYQEVKHILDTGGRIAFDCAGSVSCIYKWAGLLDPSGENFDGETNSSHMFAHLTAHYTDPSQAHPGALVTYGPGGDEHVCMVMESGSNPMLFSMGSEIGPLFISLSQESSAHVGQPVTFLDVSSLG